MSESINVNKVGVGVGVGVRVRQKLLEIGSKMLGVLHYACIMHAFLVSIL
jgi:hypothetical protein